MEKKKITMTIDDEVFSLFKELCKASAMKVSSKVELMMKEYIESVKNRENGGKSE